MDSSSHNAARGLWSNPSVAQSKESRQLLQLMKQESRLSSSQQRKRKETTRDLEKEKRRLQSILATGKEESSEDSSGKASKKKSKEAEEPNQYEEALNEIEERKQFLVDMAALGQDGPYIGIITAEISQKLRELELLDKHGRSHDDV